MIRILQIFNAYTEPGGEEIFVRRLDAFLNRQPDFSSRIAWFQSRDWTGPDAPPRWRQALWTLSNPRTPRILRSLHNENRADIWLIHNVFPAASCSVYEEARRLRVPAVQFLHNWRPYSISGSNWLRGAVATDPLRPAFLRELLHRSWRHSRAATALLGVALARLRASRWHQGVQSWIAISDFARKRFVEAGLLPDRVFALRHFWEPAVHAPSPPGDYYLFLGRLIPEKGVPCLLRAWSLLRGQLGPACPRLVIAGTGELAPTVHSAALTNPLISLVGWTNGADKHRLLAGSRGVIVPGVWWEPLGLVVYEAYEHFRPVLAACSGGLAETVADGTTGFLHTPNDAGDLARSIARLEAEPNRIQTMGEAGRRWLETHASPEEWLARFRAILAHAQTTRRT